MSILAQFGVALAMNAAVVIALLPVLHWERKARRAGVWILALISLLSPCAIATDHPAMRLMASLVTSGVLVKVYDLAIEASRGNVPRLGTYIDFVENSFWHVLRRRPMEAYRQTAFNLRTVALDGACAGLALAYAIRVFRFDWRPWPFALEHVAKVLSCYLVLAFASSALAAFWRLIGQPAMATMNHPLLARTPADFWRRWNRPTQMFLHEHIFLPAGGWRRPLRATLLTFVISALAHEYVFAIAISRVQGLQTSFFVIQGLATVATLRLHLTGWRAVVGWMLTLAFNLLTATLFFKSVAAVFPFFISR